MQVSVREAATILDVPEKTIYRWIDRNEIPFHTINEQIRFNRAELLEWATAQGIHVSPDLFAGLGADDAPLPTFREALRAGGIEYGLPGTDQQQVLRSVVDAMKLPDEIDRDLLYEVLLSRESLGSTGIGDGIAIPHVRNPVVLSVPQPTVSLCFLANPIDFNALDDQPVDALFTLISPSVRVHLHLISRLGYLLRDPAFKAAVKNRAPREELMAALARAEETIPAPKAGRSGGVQK